MKKVRDNILNWRQRCEILHSGDANQGMIQARMQEEIDDLRIALKDARRLIKRKDNARRMGSVVG